MPDVTKKNLTVYKKARHKKTTFQETQKRIYNTIFYLCVT